MYEVRNGILYQDGRRQIVLGQSYYPSFHEKKYPVPPKGDRVGEMRGDMRAMRQAGFNFVRMAALGEVRRNERGEVEVSAPFIDECVRECIRQEMLPSIRLQGYVMDLSGNIDWMMRNEKDEDMEQSWSAFIRNSLFHQGILRDNWDATQALTRHFLGLSVHLHGDLNGDADIGHNVLQASVFHDLLDIVHNFVLIARIGMRYIPFRFG